MHSFVQGYSQGLQFIVDAGDRGHNRDCRRLKIEISGDFTIRNCSDTLHQNATMMTFRSTMLQLKRLTRALL
eukprot:841325-Amorphochlora_amoeboformis.AAC.3